MTDTSQNITVDPKQEPLRLDVFLIDRLAKISRSRLQKAIKEGYVSVNEQQVKPNYKVSPGDKIIVDLPHAKRPGSQVEGEDIPLDILYEDESLLIVNKQAGMVVHPGIGNMEGTLVHALVHYLSQNDLPVLEGNLADRPGLVHRIDKDTSGILVIAKTAEAMTHLARQFSDHSIERTYKAIVWGQPDPEEDSITDKIGRHPRNRIIYTTTEDEDEGKEAITHYKVIQGLYYVSLVECRLETGRTHQIRVHMKSRGHTIFNDHRYGGDRILKGTVFNKYRQFVDNCFELCPRQALHAASLSFIHPVSHKKMAFEAPLPPDMDAVLRKWTSYVSYKRDIIDGEEAN